MDGPKNESVQLQREEGMWTSYIRSVRLPNKNLIEGIKAYTSDLTDIDSFIVIGWAKCLRIGLQTKN